MQLTILPIPDVPNANGIIFTKKCLDKAISEYRAKCVTKGTAFITNEKLTYDNNLSELLEISLVKIVGQITSIDFDDESKSYKATVKFKDNLEMVY